MLFRLQKAFHPEVVTEISQRLCCHTSRKPDEDPSWSAPTSKADRKLCRWAVGSELERPGAPAPSHSNEIKASTGQIKGLQASPRYSVSLGNSHPLQSNSWAMAERKCCCAHGRGHGAWHHGITPRYWRGGEFFLMVEPWICAT